MVAGCKGLLLLGRELRGAGGTTVGGACGYRVSHRSQDVVQLGEVEKERE